MVDDCQTTWIREETFPSVYGQGTELIEDILQAMKIRHWSERDIFAVNLAMVEAITNAIDHGNNCDPLKNVFVSCQVTQSLVSMSVRDEGAGFVLNNVPDPRSEESLDCPTGRGVLLIYGFMTKVWFNDSGNELFMEKIPSLEP